MEPKDATPNGSALIVGCGLFGVMAVACLLSALGAALVPVALCAAGLATVGATHYLLWGRRLSRDADDDASSGGAARTQ